MKKITTNDIAKYYQGDVQIKLMRGRKPYKTINVKNNGTAEFFRILCNAVAGNDYGSQMPKYVGLYNDSDDIPLNISRTHFTTVGVNNDTDGYYTEFTFIIPGSYLRTGTVSNIKLYNTTVEGAGELASVDLGEESFSITDTESNLMITWILRFKNNSEV